MRTKNFTRTATAAVLAGLLTFPTGALAATSILVDNDTYEAGARAGGTGWTWDGADDMELNSFNGSVVYAEGNLNVTLVGENTVDEYVFAEGALTLTGDGSLDTQYVGSFEELTIDGTTVTAVEIGSYGDMTITNSSVDLEGGTAGIETQGTLTIDTSHVHVVNTREDEYRYMAVCAVEDTGNIVLNNVVGDTIIEEDNTGRWRNLNISYLNGEDGNIHDILLEPLEDVNEEKTVTRTITYVFEDGSEAAATKTDAQTLTRTGKKNPLTEETTWDEWSTGSFDDVESPAIEGYTAKLVLVAGESVDGSSDDLVYEVVYVKDEEPAPEPELEPIPEPEPAPVPTPEPAKPVVPQTGDVVSGAQSLAAGIGALLSAAGITLKRRED